MDKIFRQFKILVVEDNQSMREGIVSSLAKLGFSVGEAADGKSALEKVQNSCWHLIITDIKMPIMDGLELFRKVKSIKPDIEVILVTAYATVNIAVDALKQGAEDFLTKPFSIAELRQKVEYIFERWLSRQAINGQTIKTPLIIGRSQVIKTIRQLISKIAQVHSPVLITGESGTGKELVARTIHLKSNYKNGPFIAVNCGALNENLLESELFGHEKGAFTGAIKTHSGKFEQSNNGTLFLDEIGDMSSALQVKLLRVLQTKQFQRVGGEKFIQTDFRLITATNQDLQSAVKANNFRSDLFFRLNVIPIFIPPLRDRKEDIPLLVDHILKTKSKEIDRPIPRIESGFMRKLQAYSWPGNIRELENFLERALVFIEADIFEDSLFSFNGLETKPDHSVTLESSNLIKTLEKMEREMIIRALSNNSGIKQRAAEQLKIKPSTLYYKLEKYKIKEEEYI
jgi:DNA-binding NtrC family response regulator